MFKSKSFTYATLSVLWLVNPIFNVGCDNEQPKHTFGEAEMLDLMDDINQEVWTVEDGDSRYLVEFTLSQTAEEVASLVDYFGAAHACGSRSFTASANACIDSTHLPLEGTVRISDADTAEVIVEELAIDGEMAVYGYDLTNAEVEISGESGEFYLYSNDGVSFDLQSAHWE